jgi:hypothetical protein
MGAFGNSIEHKPTQSWTALFSIPRNNARRQIRIISPKSGLRDADRLGNGCKWQGR